MLLRNRFLVVVLFGFVCPFICGQESPQASGTLEVPLVLNSDVPLRVYITQRLHMRLDEPVRAKLIEPLYAFDRIVVPSGVELEGHVTRLDPALKWARFQAILQGDFTPLHWVSRGVYEHCNAWRAHDSDINSGLPRPGYDLRAAAPFQKGPKKPAEQWRDFRYGAAAGPTTNQRKDSGCYRSDPRSQQEGMARRFPD